MADRHVAHMDSRYRYTEDDGTNVYTEERPVYCGSTGTNGVRTLCKRCEELANTNYPQGWRYYPGDTCKHGKYVGGCGADLMCGACEGEE